MTHYNKGYLHCKSPIHNNAMVWWFKAEAFETMQPSSQEICSSIPSHILAKSPFHSRKVYGSSRLKRLSLLKCLFKLKC